ncbi:hypothetical protein [Polyangium fumosum]|uniref:SH3 domain-containing protein n=1 Tax=Polyangium fumosum TaxID=889272 RepID=A0A4U1IJY5_9BACT|nr:hypothetical protein [Polyangium fumosum]TKC94177.1 hypothetical protein E8A74_48435 [Polyangium fumosum]
MSFVAVWKRSEADVLPPAPVSMVVSGNAPEVPAPVERPRMRKAVVNIRRPDLKNGVLRTLPGLDTPRAAFVPHGTLVDVGRAKTEAGQTWYHVRAVVNGVAYEGWMHADILDPVP